MFEDLGPSLEFKGSDGVEGGEIVAAENDATRLSVTSASRSLVRTVAVGVTGGCVAANLAVLAVSSDSSGVLHGGEDGGTRSSSISNTMAKPSSSGADLVRYSSSGLHTGVMLRDRLT